MSKPINFFKGHPTRNLLPVQQIADAYNKVLLGSDYLAYDADPLNQHPLTYGTDPGNYDVRTTISDWVNSKFQAPVSSPANINLTGGASYGIANILTSTTDAATITKQAFIVSPTYFLINSAFLDAGFDGKLTAISETPDSEYEIDLDHLEKKLKYHSLGLQSGEGKEINVIKDPVRGQRKLYRFVMYLVPTYSNPGGLTYSIKTRVKLIQLARKYDLLLISDDVYEFLDYTDNPTPLPRFNYLDAESIPSYKKFGNTISNATFSKIIAPGLRVGWQETPTPALVEQLAETGANKSGGTPGQLASIVVQDLIKSGQIDQIIENFTKTYKARAQTLIRSAINYLPPSAKVYGGQGGYFLWVDIKGDIDHNKVVKILQDEYKVVLASGDHFEVSGDLKGWGKNCVRLCISYLTDEEIEAGIRTWGKVLQETYPELYA
ncbi:valine--pyruvate aminotransferase [Scheffersomyces xylosifermentans]|uniref:valine--pyruvate aminotransferase n=1 Tax=Scheffersomyces xylosifermentans TaxID=1304137 RepID=UPI00315D20DC